MKSVVSSLIGYTPDLTTATAIRGNIKGTTLGRTCTDFPLQQRPLYLLLIHRGGLETYPRTAFSSSGEHGTLRPGLHSATFTHSVSRIIHAYTSHPPTGIPEIRNNERCSSTMQSSEWYRTNLIAHFTGNIFVHGSCMNKV